MKLSHAALTTLTAIAELRWPIGVGSGALLGGMVGMICIALAWRQSSGDELWHPRRELGGPNVDVFQRLRCYWAFFCLTIIVYLLRCRRKLLCKVLLGVVAVLEFYDFCADVFCDFFGVHKRDDGMPPNNESTAL